MKNGKYYLNLLPDDIKDEWIKEFSSWSSPLSIDKKKNFMKGFLVILDHLYQFHLFGIKQKKVLNFGKIFQN